MRLHLPLALAAAALAVSIAGTSAAVEAPELFPEKLKLRGVFVRGAGAGAGGAATGTLQVKFKKDKQQVAIKTKGLNGPADFDLFMQNFPGSEFYTRVTVMEVDEKGRGELAFESDGEPLRDFLGATLDRLEGLRFELRNPDNKVVLETVFQALEKPESVKHSVAGTVAPESPVALSKPALKAAFSGKKGTLKLSVKCKAEKGADLRLEIEQADGSFLEIATLRKGKAKLDTKKGESLGDVLTGADLSGRQVRITSGGDVAATFDL